VKLTLPYPVSANRYWRSFVPRGYKRALVVVSDEAKAYIREVGLEAKRQGLRKPATGLVSLIVRLIPANRVCMDLDNALKVVIDALKGIAYADDADVFKIVAERADPDGHARLEIEIDAYLPAPPPLFADAATA
jgi:crossover junction endodeoxyribonuclease RusA